MTLGERIKLIRKEKKLTQKALGELCGVNESHIRTYESGKHQPSIDSLIKLAQALEVPPWILLDFENRFSDIATGVAPLDDLDLLMESIGFELTAAPSTPTARVQLLKEFDNLNDTGQRKVVDYAKDLSRLPEYKKSLSQ